MILSENFKIRPEHIDLKGDFGRFGEFGSGKLAKAIVYYCDTIDRWQSFSEEDLQCACKFCGASTYFLKYLLKKGFLKKGGNGYGVTERFVFTCPRKNEPAETVSARRYFIRPDEIDLVGWFQSGMNTDEDKVAFVLMDLFQTRDGWVPFDENDVVKWLNYHKVDVEVFRRFCYPRFISRKKLHKGEWVEGFEFEKGSPFIRFINGKYLVMSDFVEMCHKRSKKGV